MNQVIGRQCMEYSLHCFSTEASTLGLPPGAWPMELSTNMGNGQPFVLLFRLAEGGRRYQQRLGCLLLDVFND